MAFKQLITEITESQKCLNSVAKRRRLGSAMLTSDHAHDALREDSAGDESADEEEEGGDGDEAVGLPQKV